MYDLGTLGPDHLRILNLLPCESGICVEDSTGHFRTESQRWIHHSHLSLLPSTLTRKLANVIFLQATEEESTMIIRF